VQAGATSTHIKENDGYAVPDRLEIIVIEVHQYGAAAYWFGAEVACPPRERGNMLPADHRPVQIPVPYVSTQAGR
jgi:hypothetical protein